MVDAPPSFPTGGPRFYAFYAKEEIEKLIQGFTLVASEDIHEAITIPYFEFWLKKQPVQNNFRINKTIFLAETRKTAERVWEAELTGICKDMNAGDDTDKFLVQGESEKVALDKLSIAMNELFLIRSSDIALKDVFVMLARWVFGSKKWQKIVPRMLLILLLGGVISIFFVNYQKGVLSTAMANLSFFFPSPAGELIAQADTAFLTEDFLRVKLKKADSVFWASNVSFRTFQDRNKRDLEDYLNKKKEFKLVLLDPKSYLGADAVMSKFSRTSRNANILATIQSLMDPNAGTMILHGDITKDQVYLSDYSPIIPMVRVDDSVYVSFPIHTDKNLKINNYNGPFLKFHVKSKFGNLLVQHFENMISTPGTHIIYPR